MSSSSSKPPPPHCRLHVDSPSGTTTNATAAGSASSSRSTRSSAIVVGGGAGGSGHNQACAACKYQRRKCNPDCPLAPYFPADQQRRFLNAHRLFGVSNIQKALRRIDPAMGPEAMSALIYQSEARAADPVHGCVAVIDALREQIHNTEVELLHVRHQIAMYRQAAAAGGAPGTVAHPPPMILTDDAAAAAVADAPPAGSVDAFYAAAAAAGSMQEFPGLLQQQPPQQLYNYFCYDEGGDETTNGHAGFADATVVQQQLDQHHHRQTIQAVPFTDTFDVKPQALLPATIAEHHAAGPANDDDDMEMHAEHKLARVALKHDVDHRMLEDPASPTPAPCHLERRLRRQRGAYGDFVNLEIPVQPSSTEVLIGVGCECVRS
ncbi:hypothetical protein U9M48_014222 [Paspalum notatum var. saurae]|uniref:LOB domain-containing protein n=1 Tax=Paspalum notatum var. saurae TaxID=547442 RepID=A0AAQ3T2E6_PASNO